VLCGRTGPIIILLLVRMSRSAPLPLSVSVDGLTRRRKKRQYAQWRSGTFPWRPLLFRELKRLDFFSLYTRRISARQRSAIGCGHSACLEENHRATPTRPMRMSRYMACVTNSGFDQIEVVQLLPGVMVIAALYNLSR